MSRSNRGRVDKLERELNPNKGPKTLYVVDPNDREYIQRRIKEGADEPLPEGIFEHAEEAYSSAASYQLIVSKGGIFILPTQMKETQWKRSKEDKNANR